MTLTGTGLPLRIAGWNLQVRTVLSALSSKSARSDFKTRASTTLPLASTVTARTEVPCTFSFFAWGV